MKKRQPDRKKETEIKIEAFANSQFKCFHLGKPSDIAEKILGLCRLLKIEIGDRKELHITDAYYDDSARHLDSYGCLFRRRTIAGEEETYTLKVPAMPNSYRAAVERDEVELPVGNTAELEKILCNPNTTLKQYIGSLGTLGKLTLQFEVHNHRQEIKISTSSISRSPYLLCLDKYYYSYPGGISSRYFAEIEIEGFRDNDKRLQSLVGAIKEQLGYGQNKRSKYSRGHDAQKDVQNNVFCVAMDIIGYSKHPAKVQLQLIQKLNKFTKDAMKGRSLAKEAIVYIPTGDGMIMVFEAGAEEILPVLAKIRRSVDALGVDHPRLKFKYRTGLHFGPVFKYSDINENLNYAGSGINLAQRAMSLANASEIICTVDFKNQLRELTTDISARFKHIGQRKVKHQVTLDVSRIVIS